MNQILSAILITILGAVPILASPPFLAFWIVVGYSRWKLWLSFPHLDRSERDADAMSALLSQNPVTDNSLHERLVAKHRQLKANIAATRDMLNQT